MEQNEVKEQVENQSTHVNEPQGVETSSERGGSSVSAAENEKTLNRGSPKVARMNEDAVGLPPRRVQKLISG